MYCRVTPEPITDPGALIGRVRRDSDGAVVLFEGVVRDNEGARKVTELEYEAYVEMATSTLERICTGVLESFEVGDVAVVHRIGTLRVGEVSVAIAVAAPHRDAAYKASREIIERIKMDVPIWKRERYDDGRSVWVEAE